MSGMTEMTGTNAMNAMNTTNAANGTLTSSPLSTPTTVYADLIRNVGDSLTDECLKVITTECLSLLQSVRRIETLCLNSYNDATAGASLLAAGSSLPTMNTPTSTQTP
jgi:hypothetical protein